MTSVPVENPTADKAAELASPRWWDRAEGWLNRVGDRLNPILVKETRQALKSRQFSFTFVLVLTACWLWTIGGVAMIGPRIFYSAEGPELFYGYFLILAFPLAVIVPFSAYRSLAAEQEDNTYELLSISLLTPRQIIAGKLGSALVQMLVFLSAVAPCLAFTYLLRGIDILSIGVLLYYAFFGSLGLCVVGLLFATATREKYGQVILSVGLIIGLVWCFGGAAAGASEFLRWSNQFVDDWEFWVFNGALLTAYVTYFAMAFLGAAAQLTFHSENRSTPLRVVMLLQHVCFLAWMGYAWVLGEGHVEIAIVATTIVGIHWYVMGALMTGEYPWLSHRVQRRLPQSFLGRTFLTWFNPGPGTGYLFALSNLGSVILVVLLILWQGTNWGLQVRSFGLQTAPYFMAIGFSYIVIYLGVGKLLLDMVRRVFQPTLLATGLLHFLLLMAGVCVPLVIQLMSADLRNSGYSLLQVTNPLWTLVHIVDRGALPAEVDVLMILIPLAAGVVFLLNLPALRRELAYVRVAKPQRVVQEEADLAPPAPEPVPESPWD
jgi:hypothetical protein